MENAQLEKNVIKKVTRKIVPYALLLFVVATLDKVNIGFAALTMNADLGVSSSSYGLIAGIFFIAYFFFEVPSNVMAQKIGARKWICRILISWGAVTMITGFVQNAFQLGFLRVALGIAEAGFYPCIILYLTYWFPSKNLASTVSKFMIAQGIANIVAGPISTLILSYVTWGGLAGWRWLFILEGAPAVLLGFVTLFVLIDRPEQAKYLSEEEKAWLIGVLKEECEAKDAKANHISHWEVMKQGKVWHLAGCQFCYVSALYGLGLWMPQVLKEMSSVMTTTQIGFISAIPYIFAVIVMNIVGAHSDKTGERRNHVGLPISIACFALIAFTFIHNNIWLSLALLAISTGAIYTFIGTFWTLPTAFLAESTAAVGIALINSVGNLGGFFGPYLVGFLKNATGNTNAGMYILAAAAIGCTCFVMTLPKDLGRVETKKENICETLTN